MRKSLRTIVVGGILAIGGLLCVTATADAQRFGISFGRGGGGWGGGGWGGRGGGWGGRGGATIDFGGIGHYHLGSNRFHWGPSYGGYYGGYGNRGYYGYGSGYGYGYSPYYSSGYYSQPYGYSYSQPYTGTYSGTYSGPTYQTSTEQYQGKGLVLWNPQDNGQAISFQLDGRPYTLEPGYQVTLRTQPEWTVTFDRPNQNSPASYSVVDGKSYTFRHTEQGWELHEASDQ